MLWILFCRWSMRAVYGGSWTGIAARGFALFAVYLVSCSAWSLAGLLFAAVLLR